MPWEKLQKIRSVHYEYLNYFLAASQFESSPVSALPTFTFFVFTFILFHRILHRYSNQLTPFKIKLYREIGFQWLFFYTIRIWLLIIKGVKWLTKWAEYKLMIQHSEGQFLWLGHREVQAGLLTVLTFIGMIPVTIVVMDCFWKHTIPNFLLWVGEDPWIRTEIGIAGHYLDRPPNFRPPKRKEYAYRARRSMSAEFPSTSREHPPLIRNCRSLDILTGTNSVNTFM